MNDQQNFFKLLKYSNELEVNNERWGRNNKYLSREDPEAYHALFKFLLRIEDNFHYSEKQEYIELAKDFLADQMTADDFSYSFQGTYEGITKELRRMERKESLELVNFLKPRRPQRARLLAEIYGTCDSFSLDPDINVVDEQELKDCAQILLAELQKE